MTSHVPINALASHALERYQAFRDRGRDDGADDTGQLLEALASALYALQLQLDELRQQNAELCAAQATPDADRDAFKSLFDASPDGYLVTDLEGVIRLANRIALRTLGPGMRDLPGKPLALFVPLNFRPALRRVINQMRSDPAATVTLETTFVNRQGMRTAVILRAVVAPGGRQLYWTWRDANLDEAARDAMRADAAERSRLDESLRRIELRYRSLVEHASDLVYELDERGRFTFCNDHGVRKTLGYSERELLGQWLIDFVPPELHAAVQSHLARLLANVGGTSYFEFSLHAKDGHVVRLGQHARCVLRGDDRPGIHALCRDITPQIEKLAELQRTGTQWRELSTHLQQRVEAERKRIAQEIHDDLGSMLTALRMEIALPPVGGVDVESYRRRDATLLQRLDAAIEAQRRILTGLRPSLLDNMGLCAAIDWLANDIAERTSLKCTVALQGFDEEPDIDRATALFRIVQEATTNVIRHANATRLSITQKVDDRKIVIDVVDNGRGIKTSELTNRKSFGIVGMRERAHAFGGNLKVAARRHGTRVTVWLPLRGGDSERTAGLEE